MYLVAIDTSGREGSVSLAQYELEGVCEILETSNLSGGTFSAQLVPVIQALLTQNKISKHDVSAFAVATGPGSFTGLRIGLTAVKALAEILDKPIAAVSLLSALAIGSQRTGRVISALDAGRGEYYMGIHDFAHPAEERLSSLAELVATAKDAVLVTSEPALAAAARSAAIEVVEVTRPGSSDIARIGCEKILSSSTVSPEDLDATYIRRAVS
jgi:tRNA threonylcarbamoyladenosine biosynthesis protein TsaB